MDNKIEKTGIFETLIGLAMDAVPIICAFLIVIWTGRAYAEGYGLFVQKGLDSAGDAHSEMVTLTEEDASSALKVGKILEDMSLISNRYTFVVKAKLTGHSHTIVPGTFIISSDMTMEQILERLSVDPAEAPAETEKNAGEVPADDGIQNMHEEKENKDVWGSG